MDKPNISYTFTVATVGGVKAFVPADDQTSRMIEQTRKTTTPSHFNGNEFDTYFGGDKQVTIERNNEIIDSGIVGYRGGHSGDVFFMNFKESYRNASSHLAGTPYLLEASALQEGDKVTVSSPKNALNM